MKKVTLSIVCLVILFVLCIGSCNDYKVNEYGPNSQRKHYSCPRVVCTFTTQDGIELMQELIICFTWHGSEYGRPIGMNNFYDQYNYVIDETRSLAKRFTAAKIMENEKYFKRQVIKRIKRAAYPHLFVEEVKTHKISKL